MSSPSLSRVPYTILSRLTIWLFSAYGIIQGLAICWGGPGRWNGPGYAVVRQLPGSPYSWGILLAAFGATALVGSITRTWAVKLVGLVGMAVWSFCFAGGSLTAMLTNPSVGTTGAPVYFVVGAAILVVSFVDETRPREPRS